MNSLFIEFHVVAIDEFGRKFNNVRWVPVEEFECHLADYKWRLYFEYMIRPMLEQMGTLVSAEWHCEMMVPDVLTFK